MIIDNLIDHIEKILNKDYDKIMIYMNIKKLLQNINNEELLNELNDYKFIKKTIQQNFLSDNIYERKIIYNSNKFDIILIDWELNSYTKIHDHPDKGCIVKVLDNGILYEENFDKNLYLININTLKLNDIGYKIGNNILHRIICRKSAKSLHIYIPGNFECSFY